MAVNVSVIHMIRNAEYCASSPEKGLSAFRNTLDLVSHVSALCFNQAGSDLHQEHHQVRNSKPTLRIDSGVLLSVSKYASHIRHCPTARMLAMSKEKVELPTH